VPRLTNSVGIELALIPPGAFLMGSPDGADDRSDGEGPQHEVEISRPFYLGVYPVTQRQWRRLARRNPS
jgi:formylglycine-generating enzyme required for sulfatase activity